MTTARYDRQIRLWGEEGQTSIQETSVCVLGSSSVSTETLKNLVLAGIKSFHVVDDAVITESDLGKNFFVTESELGMLRAQVITGYLVVCFSFASLYKNHLQELNPSVTGTFTDVSPLRYPLEKLLEYSIIISTCLTRAELIPIAEFLYEKNVPLIDARLV